MELVNEGGGRTANGGAHGVGDRGMLHQVGHEEVRGFWEKESSRGVGNRVGHAWSAIRGAILQRSCRVKSVCGHGHAGRARDFGDGWGRGGW